MKTFLTVANCTDSINTVLANSVLANITYTVGMDLSCTKLWVLFYSRGLVMSAKLRAYQSMGPIQPSIHFQLWLSHLDVSWPSMIPYSIKLESDTCKTQVRL